MKPLILPLLLMAVIFLQVRIGSSADPDEILRATSVAAPPAESPNRHYPSNRPPLVPSPLVKLPIGA